MAGKPAPKFVVRCPDWEHRATTREAAERWVAEVERIGACQHVHQISEISIRRSERRNER